MRPYRTSSTVMGRRLGQTIALFGLMFTVVCGTMGLAIDTGMSFLATDQAERAASAGAAAGVEYMPQDFPTASSVAVKVAGDNGIVNGSQMNGNAVSVVASRYPSGCAGAACAPNRLSVTVTETVAVSFMRILGFGAHKVVTTDTSEYLRPVGLGQPGPQLGADDMTFGNPADPGNFMMEEEGWDVGREGDAFTPNPAVNYPSDPTRPDIHELNAMTGTDTVGQPLQRGGYNYLIFVPAGKSIQARVYNPSDAPTDLYMPPGATVPIDEGHFMGPDPTALPPNSDFTHDPTAYAQMAYSLFAVQSVFSRQYDQALTRMVDKPIDAWNAPNGYYNLYGGAAVTGMPSLFHQWVNVGATDSSISDAPLTTFSGSTAPVSGASGAPLGLLTGGTAGAYYRLRVDMLDSQGNDPDPATGPTVAATHMKATKFYSVQAWDPAAGSTCGGCTVSALDDMAFQIRLLPSAGATTSTIPLMAIPPEYAGRNIDIRLFDPGDLAPANAAVPIPTSISASPQAAVVDKGEVAEVDASIEYQPPPATSMQQYVCDSLPGGGYGPSGTGTPVPVQFYDGNPAAGGTLLADNPTYGNWTGTATDACGDGGNPGEAWIDTTQLSVGTHTIYVEYVGNSALLASQAITTVTVRPTAKTVSCAIKPTGYSGYNEGGGFANLGGDGPNTLSVDSFIRATDGSGGVPPGTADLYAGPGRTGLVWNTHTEVPDTWWGDITAAQLPPGNYPNMEIYYEGATVNGVKYLPCSVTFSLLNVPTLQPPNNGGGGGGGGGGSGGGGGGGSGGGGSGGSGWGSPTRYDGAAWEGALPNYRPSTSHTVLLSASQTNPVELKILEPDGTVAPAVTIRDLGPSQYGTTPCPDFPTGCPVAADYQDGAGLAAEYSVAPPSGDLYHSKWLAFTIKVPVNYNPGPSDYWSLQYIVQPGNSPQDSLTVVAGSSGSPIHLVD